MANDGRPTQTPAEEASSATSLFAELAEYLHFDAQDIENLRSLAQPLESHLPAVVDHFFQELLRHRRTRALLGDDPSQLERLRGKLLEWLRSLFSGTYDAAYVRHHARIGRVHVEVGVPQRYIFAAIEVIRQELKRALLASGVEMAEAKLESLEKLLVIEEALMVESYQGTFVEQVLAMERDAVRERLTQAEHLAQIGQLAASLAHEIKNPLAGISGAIQVIRDAMEPKAPHRPILGEILRQINRLDRTVKDLLVYARPLPPRFDRCNLSRVVERVMMLMKREPAMQRIRLENRVDHRPLPSIEADENQVEQLLMNLLLNAADASEDGELITLTTRPIPTGLQLEVEDHGHGMDSDTCQRALEPFFTTKSRGTGLGLPICRRIVDAHHGTLSIRSVVGKETIVCVQLPYSQPRRSRGLR